MLVPLLVLALGSIFAGGLTYGLFTGGAGFWKTAITILPHHDVHEAIHHLPLWATKLPLVAGLTGLALALVGYVWKKGLPDQLAARFKSVYAFLYNKWYVDELYDRFFVKPMWCLGLIFWKRGDQGLIDPYLPDGAANLVDRASLKASRFQSGLISQYALVMLLGLVAFTIWQLFKSGVIAHG
jgi:NADH-quinone oxidoreductase subunit L